MSFFILLIMILTFLTVVAGFILMTRSEETNRKFSTKLMSLRVALQALAILLLLAAAAIAS